MLGNRFGNIQTITSSPFVPTDIAGCVLWLDGSDPLGNGTPPADNTALQFWVDKSVNSNTFSQSNAGKRPVYKTNIQNSLGVVNFTPLLLFDSSSANLFPTGNAVRSLFAVFYLRNDVDQAGTLFYTGDISSVPLQFSLEVNSGDYFVKCGSDRSGGSPTTNTWYYFGLNSNAGVISADYTFTQNSSPVTLVAPAGSPNTALTQLNVGGFNNGGQVDGYIAEILYYNVSLTSGQMTNVNNYLANKWGV